MTEEEQIREEIAKNVRNTLELPADEYDIDQISCMITDQILSIKGIRIECENQELPEISYFGESYDAADEAQQDMLKAGWVKCKVKE